MSKGRILYHYCGMNAFMSILKSKSLWLSDITKSNDAGEIRHAMKMMEAKAVKRLHDTCPPDYQSAFTEEILDQIIRSILPGLEWRYYAICFSLVPDLLSQWRCYADDAEGCAIGLSEDALARNESQSGIPDFQITCVMSDVKYTDVVDADWLGTLDVCTDLDAYSDLILETADAYVNDSCLIKSPFFAEEKEVRFLMKMESLIRPFVVIHPANPIPIRVESNKNSLFCYEKLVKLGVKARYANRRIVGYLDFSFEEYKDSAVREIVLGPKCKSSVDDIKTLLAIEGFDPSSVDVRRSVGTYR